MICLDRGTKDLARRLLLFFKLASCSFLDISVCKAATVEMYMLESYVYLFCRILLVTSSVYRTELYSVGNAMLPYTQRTRTCLVTKGFCLLGWKWGLKQLNHVSPPLPRKCWIPLNHHHLDQSPEVSSSHLLLVRLKTHFLRKLVALGLLYQRSYH